MGTPQNSTVIRPATAADMEQVIAIDTDITNLSKPQYWADIFALYAQEPGVRQRHFLVADQGQGVVAGFIIGEVRAWEFGSPPCGWVFAIGIRSGMRQSGVGQALFKEISDRFRAGGMGQLRTMLARDNNLIMSFFRSQGMMAGPFVQLEKDL